MPRFRSTAVPLLTALGVLAVAGGSHAHEFWIIPNAFALDTGQPLEIRGQTSSLFPTSESPVSPERVADGRVIAATGEAPLREFSVAGRSLFVRYRPVAAGQRVVAIALRPRTVRESPASFRRYMQLEGAPEALARYEQEGRLPAIGSTDSITRRYAKYAKTIVEVGRGGARAFGRAAGHPLELVPLADPAALRPGDTLALRILLLGRPLAGAHVHAGAVPTADARALTDTAAARAASARDVSLASDSTGIVRVVVDRAGIWNVRSIQIVPAERGAGVDWDVHWATVVFRVTVDVREPLLKATRFASDSAAVADAVHRYGSALAAGDSATVLDLLAPDAVILESGGAETRDEYRAHHLPGDIAFARAVRSDDSPVRVTVVGDAAWAWSTSATTGEYRGRSVNSLGAELMVLSRGADGRWRIRAIHWSSRARRTP